MACMPNPRHSSRRTCLLAVRQPVPSDAITRPPGSRRYRPAACVCPSAPLPISAPPTAKALDHVLARGGGVGSQHARNHALVGFLVHGRLLTRPRPDVERAAPLASGRPLKCSACRAPSARFARVPVLDAGAARRLAGVALRPAQARPGGRGGGGRGSWQLRQLGSQPCAHVRVRLQQLQDALDGRVPGGERCLRPRPGSAALGLAQDAADRA